MREISYKPIGIIHSPFKELQGMPIQSTGAIDVEGTIEISSDYIDGLKDLNGFSHVHLLYHFHLSTSYKLIVKPFLDKKLHGVFATRAPRRPNAIGLSVVRLVKIEGNTLYIKDVDVVDSTPLLDIKPYVPEFDVREVQKIGWLSGQVKAVYQYESDNRFAEE
ncbi:MAG: tRNA (N6-threonylcarbamoyladenosine(37)-N6)-methyltransferase TrmO [Candidatus Odinarchaeota archaeon]